MPTIRVRKTHGEHVRKDGNSKGTRVRSTSSVSVNGKTLRTAKNPSSGKPKRRRKR